MGVTVYGSYIDTFLKYCIPSLLAEGNFPALSKERHIIINVHTDLAGRALLTDKLANIDHVEWGITPDVIKSDDKYEQLGRHQNADLREAKRISADYHCLMPDFIYSHNCFANVLRSPHKAICRLVLSTSQEQMLPSLRPYFIDTLSISAEALATLALKHIHPGVKHWLATKEGYPASHVIVWEGQNTLHMCSPHCTPVYIAHEVNNAGNYVLPLDGILDRIIKGEIYCTKPSDEIVIAEISPDKGRKPDEARVDLNEFCRCMKWDINDSFMQLHVFNSETIDPICRKLLGDTWWNDVEISVEKNKVVTEMMKKMGVEDALVR